MQIIREDTLMTISDQPGWIFAEDVVSGSDAGHRFYDAVLRSGFLMEPGWPNPIAGRAMSDRAVFDRLSQERPLEAGPVGKAACHFDGCDYARAA